MAGLKDIKRRIKSVKNTKKITYAMKLVSAAKLKKAQDSVTASRAYTDELTGLLAQLLREQDASEFSHPLFEVRADVRKIRIVVLGGSRGLCGGYNANVAKRTSQALEELSNRHPEAEIQSVLLGKKVGEFYRRTKRQYLKSYETLSEDANEWPIDEICAELETDFLSEEIDEAYVIYTRFKSAMSQSVEFTKLLPMEASELAAMSTEEGGAEEPSALGRMLFKPSPAAVYEAIVPRILRTRVRQAGLDAKASEHGSRMVAMDSATSNAGELIHKLTLTHNKLRQSAITAELLDIIGGANAIEK